MVLRKVSWLQNFILDEQHPQKSHGLVLIGYTCVVRALQLLLWLNEINIYLFTFSDSEDVLRLQCSLLEEHVC